MRRLIASNSILAARRWR
ncbi:hypothetical protein, partial [Escherichia coli]